MVADQWGCDVPLRGSDLQGIHVDYQRPLFAEAPELVLPPYMLTVSFGLVRHNTRTRSYRNCAGDTSDVERGSAASN